jgi:hypothetical protein
MSRAAVDPAEQAEQADHAQQAEIGAPRPEFV